MASSPERNPIALPVATERKSDKDRHPHPRERIKPVFEPGKFLSETGAELTARQIDFGKAMEAYKRKNRRPHSTYSQVSISLVEGATFSTDAGHWETGQIPALAHFRCVAGASSSGWQ